jgi:alkylation response protein AidB-like acyl-CoA dehydrogenase
MNPAPPPTSANHLCAAGSFDFEFRDVFVPDRFVHAFQPEPRLRGDSIPLAERELVHSEVGRIEARLGAARAFLREAMTDLLDAVATASTIVPARVRFRVACTFASENALGSIGRLTEIAGAVAILQSCPLERYERDARAAAKHLAMSPAAYITAGKQVLGQDLSQAQF